SGVVAHVPKPSSQPQGLPLPFLQTSRAPAACAAGPAARRTRHGPLQRSGGSSNGTALPAVSTGATRSFRDDIPRQETKGLPCVDDRSRRDEGQADREVKFRK